MRSQERHLVHSETWVSYRARHLIEKGPMKAKKNYLGNLRVAFKLEMLPVASGLWCSVHCVHMVAIHCWVIILFYFSTYLLNKSN